SPAAHSFPTRRSSDLFMAALSTGDMQGLVEVLAPDVVFIADGGGLTAAPRKPVTGVEKVMVFLTRASKVPDLVATTAWLNGMPRDRKSTRLNSSHVSI